MSLVAVLTAISKVVVARMGMRVSTYDLSLNHLVLFCWKQRMHSTHTHTLGVVGIGKNALAFLYAGWQTRLEGSWKWGLCAFQHSCNSRFFQFEGCQPLLVKKDVAMSTLMTTRKAQSPWLMLMRPPSVYVYAPWFKVPAPNFMQPWMNLTWCWWQLLVVITTMLSGSLVRELIFLFFHFCWLWLCSWWRWCQSPPC